MVRLSALAVLRLITNSIGRHKAAHRWLYIFFEILLGKEVGFDEPVGETL